MFQPDPETALPTMYDLPSDDPNAPGLPDEFHSLQPWLLQDTFYPPHHSREEIFIASNLNLYYDQSHQFWYKKPDWFAVLNTTRMYRDGNLRFSYVIWQEKVSPFIAVELLSPGTEDEDLGTKLRHAQEPPRKWEVYERILQIPYYAVFDRYNNYKFQMFELKNGRYIEARISDDRFWIPEIELGLGVWRGSYHRTTEQPWLRWYDVNGNWLLLAEELQKQRADFARQQKELERQQADFEKQQADFARQQKERLIAQLRALGIEPNLI
jgi:Uma2 family endonuclease